MPYREEPTNTVHIGVYVDNPDDYGNQTVHVQSDVFKLSSLKVGEDPTGKTHDTNFEYLGERAAGISLICTKGLEQVVVHPGKHEYYTVPTLPIKDTTDLGQVAMGIAKFHHFRIGVRVSEKPLELPAPHSR